MLSRGAGISSPPFKISEEQKLLGFAFRGCPRPETSSRLRGSALHSGMVSSSSATKNLSQNSESPRMPESKSYTQDTWIHSFIKLLSSFLKLARGVH